MSTDQDNRDINEICDELDRGMEMLAYLFTAAIAVVAVAAIIFVIYCMGY